MKTILETARLSLREFTPEDYGALTKHYYGMDMPHTIFYVRAEELSRGPDTP